MRREFTNLIHTLYNIYNSVRVFISHDSIIYNSAQIGVEQIHIILSKQKSKLILNSNLNDLVLRPIDGIKPDCQTTTAPKPPPFPLNDSLFGYGVRSDPQINVEVHDLKTT
jgi:hypothetical protein